MPDVHHSQLCAFENYHIIPMAKIFDSSSVSSFPQLHIILHCCNFGGSCLQNPHENNSQWHTNVVSSWNVGLQVRLMLHPRHI